MKTPANGPVELKFGTRKHALIANSDADKASEFKRVLGNLLKAWPPFSCNHLRQKSLNRVGANSV